MTRFLVASLAAFSVLSPMARALEGDPYADETPAQRDARMAWWREAKFGMFIHWGLYAIPAGEWKGKETPGIGEWIMDTMKIPAFAPDTMHSFAFDPTPFLSGGKPFLMYSANLHMHQLGTRAKLSLQRKDGSEDCLLDIPRWNFHWQGSYGFPAPKVVNPGDKVYLECHWDNTPPMQPIVDGKAQMPKDVFWGEGTTDEMCLGGFYMVAP